MKGLTMKLFAALLALTLSLAGCGPVDGDPIRSGAAASDSASRPDAVTVAQLRQQAEQNGSLAAVLYLGSVPERTADVDAALRDKSKTENKAFIQGIERFMDAMGDHVYTALFLADPVSENDQASIRSSYEQLYSTLSPFRKSTWSYNENHSNAVMSSVCDGKSNVITDGTSASSSKSRGSDMGFSLNLGI